MSVLVLWRLRYLSLVLICFLFVACQSQTYEEDSFRQSYLVFGTIVELKLVGIERQKAWQLSQQVQAKLQAYHEAWHAWQPSELTQINQAIAQHQSIAISSEMADLLRLSTRLSEQSGELFNPAIGRLIRLWGFQRHEEKPWTPPSDKAIQAYLFKAPHMSDITIENGRLSSNNDTVQLDFGAIAKGYAIEKIAGFLRANGVRHAIINAGGNLKALGNPQGKPWRIGIQNPNQAGIVGILFLDDNESVATSGNYRRYYTYAGKTYHHVIDPRTGRPSEGSVSATIIANDASVADATATAFMINGTENWQELAKRFHLKYILLMDKNGQITMSKAMALRVELLPEFKKKVSMVDFD